MIKFKLFNESVNWSSEVIKDGDRYKEPLGFVPMQTVGEVDYRGLTAITTPEIFKRLAKPRTFGSDSNIDFIVKQMEEGAPIATPWLQIEIKTDLDKIYIRSHEGRTRTEAFRKLNGNAQMPIILFVYIDGNKVKNNDKENVNKVIEMLKGFVWSENGNDLVKNPFKEISIGFNEELLKR